MNAIWLTLPRRLQHCRQLPLLPRQHNSRQMNRRMNLQYPHSLPGFRHLTVSLGMVLESIALLRACDFVHTSMFVTTKTSFSEEMHLFWDLCLRLYSQQRARCCPAKIHGSKWDLQTRFARTGSRHGALSRKGRTLNRIFLAARPFRHRRQHRILRYHQQCLNSIF